MTFSKYHIYLKIVADRDHVVLVIMVLVIVALAVLGYVRGFLPKHFRLASWVIGAGGFYATLAAWAAYLFAHPTY